MSAARPICRCAFSFTMRSRDAIALGLVQNDGDRLGAARAGVRGDTARTAEELA